MCCVKHERRSVIDSGRRKCLTQSNSTFLAHKLLSHLHIHVLCSCVVSKCHILLYESLFQAFAAISIRLQSVGCAPNVGAAYCFSNHFYRLTASIYLRNRQPDSSLVLEDGGHLECLIWNCINGLLYRGIW